MIFAIDENESKSLTEHWNLLFPKHEFHHVSDLGLSGTPDTVLFDQLPAHGVQVLITRDRNQLHVPEELAALKRSGLSWIGHKESNKKGLSAMREIIATYAICIPHVVEAINSQGAPLRFSVKKLPNSPSQRLNAWRLSDQSKLVLPR